MLTYANGIAVFDNKPNGTFEAELKLFAIERMPKRNALKLMKLMRECASEAEWAALYEDAIAVAGERTREAYAKANGERKEPSMKRVKFYVMQGTPKPMDGYEFTSPCGDKLYVHKEIRSKGWTITDPETGLSIIPSFAGILATRADALKWAGDKHLRNGETAYEYLHEFKKRELYVELVHKFEDACATTIEPTATKEDKPMNTKTTTAKKTATKKEGAAMKKTAKKTETRKTTTKAAPKKAAAKKVAPKKHEYKPVVAELRFGPIESPWEGVAITQKRPDACIWVSGKTAQCANQLKALGYRYSRKRRAWWRKPDAA